MKIDGVSLVEPSATDDPYAMGPVAVVIDIDLDALAQKVCVTHGDVMCVYVVGAMTAVFVFFKLGSRLIHLRKIAKGVYLPFSKTFCTAEARHATMPMSRLGNVCVFSCRINLALGWSLSRVRTYDFCPPPSRL